MARPGGPGGDPDRDGAEGPARGRHRSPDAEGGAPVLAASSLVGAPRHRRARPDGPDGGAEDAGPAGLPARSLARVEAAQEAASRPRAVRPVSPLPTAGAPGATAGAPDPTAGAPGPGSPTAPVRRATPAAEPARDARPDVPTPGSATPGRARDSAAADAPEEAVTDLVVRPGRGALADGPGTGPEPAVLGAVVSVVALVAAVVAAVVAAPGGSHVTLVGTLAVALLGTATSALGLGRQRPRRALAAAGVVVGVAAVVAGVIPLLAL
ncbi:hypothetical protein [Actinomycetospora corticicola]|uniref:Uncharacterized protein n=1 Tax=Actinomycetospora corticicola TaxID=663602 RepID=A0A7Y9J790_9PSEU|nr:hypothetical protein [Actinomycetospora corticicola]NYD38227.1 hypothetical protein [Actinomycetospora corticicola]